MFLRWKKYLRLRSLAIVIIVLIVCAGLFVYAKTRSSKNAFKQAEDFPRGALVYAQFENLSALIKQWNESHLKQQYLDSTNYRQFHHSHVALKLIERWEEFNSALDFPLDTAAISSAAEGGAAIAIYDIGRLDLVFVAPMSDEKVAATKFFTSKDGFEETELPDGTVYYRHEVEADRGRQKQVLVFAAAKGRFILATNEQLLLRTIANINGKAHKDRLSDDPGFNALSAVVNPHFVTVWVDQAKLNDDYYFKHYWLMQNVGELKSIRAGMFDLELQAGKWIERRDFLITGKGPQRAFRISGAEMARMQAQVPNDVPFLKIEALGDDLTLITKLIHDTLLDRQLINERQQNSSWSWESYSDSEFYSTCDEGDEVFDRYSYLSPAFDSTIDDPQDARIAESEEPGENPSGYELEKQFAAGLQQAVAPAQPLAAAVATSPRTIQGPLFVEFQRVAILVLKNPTNLNRDVLEESISKAAQSRLTVAGPSVDLKWVSREANAEAWRELELPMLDWHFCYALRDRELILSNSPEFLNSLFSARAQKPAADLQAGPSLDNLTLIRLDQRKQAFDDIVGKIDAEAIKAHQLSRKTEEGSETLNTEFFSGSLSSLLDVAAAVRQIEIKRSSSPNRLHEEIAFVLK
ncbi:MAG TPA: hypothetical protein VIF64_19160 [Pyrinomonadaceae bacterium]